MVIMSCRLLTIESCMTMKTAKFLDEKMKLVCLSLLSSLSVDCSLALIPELEVGK